MQLERAKTSEVDALDLAAIWPCCAQLAGLSLPPMETVQARELAHPDEVDSDGLW
jgi:hypothetical protein